MKTIEQLKKEIGLTLEQMAIRATSIAQCKLAAKPAVKQCGHAKDCDCAEVEK